MTDLVHVHIMPLNVQGLKALTHVTRIKSLNNGTVLIGKYLYNKIRVTVVYRLISNGFEF